MVAADKLVRGKSRWVSKYTYSTDPPRAVRFPHNVDKSHRMVPPVLPVPSIPSSGLLLALASAASHHVPPLRNPLPDDRLGPGEGAAHAFVRRDIHDPDQRAVFVIYSCLIPILVLLSGLFAGLTLGYMSLDETQLNVLSVSGTP